LWQIVFRHFTNNNRLPKLNWLAGWLENFDHYKYAMHACDYDAFILRNTAIAVIILLKA
jgi:hypothetical protein